MSSKTTRRGHAAPISVSSHETLTSDAERLEAGGYAPEHYVIDGPISTAVSSAGTVTYRFKAVRKHHDLAAFHNLANQSSKAPFKLDRDLDRAAVISLADMQIGKVGSRGGTAEALARCSRVRAKVIKRLRKSKPSLILLADVGDGMEGFESGGNPMFTNDLSLPEMLDLYACEVWLWVQELARIAPVIVTIVPSNHAAWRNGRQTLGNPGDDFGIYVHKQVEKLANASRIDATWVYPNGDFEDTVVVDVLGTKVGVVHGHQHGPGAAAAIAYWQKQTFGSQPLADCDIVVEGHYHHWWFEDVSETKVIMGSPTLDNGSDWYRNMVGRETKPGLLVFEITRDGGFDSESMVVIRDDQMLSD